MLLQLDTNNHKVRSMLNVVALNSNLVNQVITTENRQKNYFLKLTAAYPTTLEWSPVISPLL